MEISRHRLPDAIVNDLIKSKNSFTDNKVFTPHAIYTDDNYQLEGININMRNEFYNESHLPEKPIRFRFHITKFSFTS